jgi:hypothetical protein
MNYDKHDRELLYAKFRECYPNGNKEKQRKFSQEIADSRVGVYIEIFSSKK